MFWACNTSNHVLLYKSVWGLLNEYKKVPTEMWCVWLLQHWSQQMAQPATSNLEGTAAHCKDPPEPLDSTVFWRQELEKEDAQCFCGAFVSQATESSDQITCWNDCCKQLIIVIYLKNTVFGVHSQRQSTWMFLKCKESAWWCVCSASLLPACSWPLGQQLPSDLATTAALIGRLSLLHRWASTLGFAWNSWGKPPKETSWCCG